MQIANNSEGQQILKAKGELQNQIFIKIAVFRLTKKEVLVEFKKTDSTAKSDFKMDSLENKSVKNLKVSACLIDGQNQTSRIA